MILYRWQGRAPNFGDELNTMLWSRLLPNFFDDDPSVLFLGIGSVLDNRHAAGVLKLVVGAGYGGYEPPAALDGAWRIQWVRGPRSARLLGLDPALGLGDPAALLPVAGISIGGGGTKIGFMPHFESAMHGAWAQAAEAAGAILIDPRGDPSAVVEAIRDCRVLLSEALHGIIVADALRVPWIAIQPRAPIHRPKWEDWADTLDLSIVFRTLPPSTLPELAHASIVARWHAGRALLERHADHLRPIGARRLIAQASEALHAATRATPQLSDDRTLERGQARMMDSLAALRRQAAHGHFQGWRSEASPAFATPSERPETLPPRSAAFDPSPGWRACRPNVFPGSRC